MNMSSSTNSGTTNDSSLDASVGLGGGVCFVANGRTPPISSSATTSAMASPIGHQLQQRMLPMPIPGLESSSNYGAMGPMQQPQMVSAAGPTPSFYHHAAGAAGPNTCMLEGGIPPQSLPNQPQLPFPQDGMIRQPMQQQWQPMFAAMGADPGGCYTMPPQSSACKSTKPAGVTIRNPFEQEELEALPQVEARRAKSTPPDRRLPSIFEWEQQHRENVLGWRDIPAEVALRLPYAFNDRPQQLIKPYPVEGVGPSPMNPLIHVPHALQQHFYQQRQQWLMARGLMPPGCRLGFPGPHPAAMGHLGPPRGIPPNPPPAPGRGDLPQRAGSVPTTPAPTPTSAKPAKAKKASKKQTQQAAAANGDAALHNQLPANTPEEQGKVTQHMAFAGPWPASLHPMTEFRFVDENQRKFPMRDAPFNGPEVCRRCQKPINHAQGIRCTALSQGCGATFHFRCADLSQEAAAEIMRESCIEWICNDCYGSKPVIFSI